MSWILLLNVVITILASVSSWTGVQISTCNAPIDGELISFCCFTSNLPAGASIYFSKNSQHVIRISQSCEQIWVRTYSDIIINKTCSSTGSLSNYSIVLREIFSELVVNDTWECGFYGNKSTMVIKDGTILDEHRYLRQDAGSNGTLYIGNTLSSLTVRMYNIEDPSRTLLLVDENNTPTVNVPWIHFRMNNTQNMYYVDITNILYSYNGTYVFEKQTGNGHVSHSGVTLVVNKIPTIPTINASTNWRLADNKAIGSVVCVSYSQSAAPLYYAPEMETQWRLPGQADWITDVSKYLATIINNTVNISDVDCNKPTLPIYCSVIDGPFKSLFSQGFDPHSMCEVLGYKKPEPFIGDPRYRSLVIIVCILVTSTVFTFVITTVVARHFLKKKAKRCGRKCKRCCVCCANLMPSSSDSDSDSDYREARSNSRRDRNGNRDGRGLSDFLNLADGLDPPNRDSTIDRALAQIAIEESRLQQQIQQASDGADNPGAQINNVDNASLDVQVDEQGAVGGVAPLNPRLDNAKQQLVEVETLLSNHNSHLSREVVCIRVDRKHIVDNLLNYYCEENVALSQVQVQMIGEEGLDYGGVAYDMYTTFWYRVQEDHFLGSDRVVPHLLPHKMADEHKYRILGRILSHSIAVLKSFPIPMCKSAIIAMIFETTDVSQETILEDFLYFLDEIDRRLVTTAIYGFSNLTNDEKTELGTIFERYDYAVVLTESNFHQHLAQLARHVVCVRPKTLLDKMRSGIPQVHMQHFWSFLHQDLLTILFQALQPTASRVIARLKTEDDHEASSRQVRVLNYLKGFLRETSQVELETFLVFVTGKKSMPRQPITIAFTTERGTLRTPRAHTCSSMMELPETYESYDTFRSEFKHLLASDEAQTMTMA